MKCKVLILTHGKLAESFLETSKLISGETEGIAFMNMPEVMDVEKYRNDINDIVVENKETGLLIITDLLGGSPFLISSKIFSENKDSVELITGCNLCMILEIASHIETSTVKELKEIAINAGKQGIIDLKERIGK